MLEIEKVTVISDEMRAVVEGEWPEPAIGRSEPAPRYSSASFFSYSEAREQPGPAQPI